MKEPETKIRRIGGGNFMRQTWPIKQFHGNQCAGLIKSKTPVILSVMHHRHIISESNI
jgi:hypothetical protein